MLKNVTDIRKMGRDKQLNSAGKTASHKNP
jgi:hypothetical protein